MCFSAVRTAETVHGSRTMSLEFPNLIFSVQSWIVFMVNSIIAIQTAAHMTYLHVCNLFDDHPQHKLASPHFHTLGDRCIRNMFHPCVPSMQLYLPQANGRERQQPPLHLIGTGRRLRCFLAATVHLCQIKVWYFAYTSVRASY